MLSAKYRKTEQKSCLNNYCSEIKHLDCSKTITHFAITFFCNLRSKAVSSALSSATNSQTNTLPPPAHIGRQSRRSNQLSAQSSEDISCHQLRVWTRMRTGLYKCNQSFNMIFHYLNYGSSSARSYRSNYYADGVIYKGLTELVRRSIGSSALIDI